MANIILVNTVFAEETRSLLKNEQVASFEKGTPLRKVVEVMTEKNIGCVVITGYGRPIGIFTERDLLRKVVGKVNVDTELVDKHMTPHPVCVGLKTPIMDVMTKMRKGNFRHLVLTDDDGMLSGIISVKDLLNCLVDNIAKSMGK